MLRRSVCFAFTEASARCELPRATLTRHFTDNLPDVNVDEIEVALKQLRNGNTPGEDGVLSEFLKAGGKPILEELKRL